jgi:hypothetical protein
VSWYAACFLKERVREERIRSRSDEEAPVQRSRQHRFRTRSVSMCGTGEHHHLDYAVPSSPAVILGAIGKATKRIGLTNAVTVLSTFHRSGHRYIETIRRPFWASSRVGGRIIRLTGSCPNFRLGRMAITRPEPQISSASLDAVHWPVVVENSKS